MQTTMKLLKIAAINILVLIGDIIFFKCSRYFNISDRKILEIVFKKRIQDGNYLITKI